MDIARVDELLETVAASEKALNVAKYRQDYLYQNSTSTDPATAAAHLRLVQVTMEEARTAAATAVPALKELGRLADHVLAELAVLAHRAKVDGEQCSDVNVSPLLRQVLISTKREAWGAVTLGDQQFYLQPRYNAYAWPGEEPLASWPEDGISVGGHCTWVSTEPVFAHPTAVATYAHLRSTGMDPAQARLSALDAVGVKLTRTRKRAPASSRTARVL